MSQDELKLQVALAAIEHIRPLLDPGAAVGIGTGSTVDIFIDALAAEKHRFVGAVPSSERSAQRLRSHGIELVDLNSIESLPVYVDGADEVTRQLSMIKGGGGALVREKIVAAVAEQFLCIADASKLVATLGKYPLPVEVIPIAYAYVRRRLLALPQRPRESVEVNLRTAGSAGSEPMVTDNGNYILDVRGLKLDDPVGAEAEINSIVGVVASGLFAARGADLLLLGTEDGVKTIQR
jgi:ribose 5-phosphate isomerase A